MQKYYHEIVRELANLKSVAIYYREWSTVENLILLGEKYVHDLKRELPPHIFLTSIMSEKVTKLPEEF